MSEKYTEYLVMNETGKPIKFIRRINLKNDYTCLKTGRYFPAPGWQENSVVYDPDYDFKTPKAKSKLEREDIGHCSRGVSVYKLEVVKTKLTTEEVRKLYEEQNK